MNCSDNRFVFDCFIFGTQNSEFHYEFSYFVLFSSVACISVLLPSCASTVLLINIGLTYRLINSLPRDEHIISCMHGSVLKWFADFSSPKVFDASYRILSITFVSISHVIKLMVWISSFPGLQFLLKNSSFITHTVYSFSGMYLPRLNLKTG